MTATPPPESTNTGSDELPSTHRPEYKTWGNMRNRCFNPKVMSYKNYGGRGITVCRGWRDSYKQFLSDMGSKPTPKHEIDRIDNDGNYSCGHCEQCVSSGWPANCRWTNRSINNINNRFRSVRTALSGHFDARINYDNKYYHIGTFPTRKQALHAYDIVKEIIITIVSDYDTQLQEARKETEQAIAWRDAAVAEARLEEFDEIELDRILDLAGFQIFPAGANESRQKAKAALLAWHQSALLKAIQKTERNIAKYALLTMQHSSQRDTERLLQELIDDRNQKLAAHSPQEPSNADKKAGDESS